MTAADIVDAKLEDEVWLWDNVLPRDCLTILSAAPKTGKSTFLYPLLVSMLHGKPFLGLDCPIKCRIVLMALEERRTTVLRRLQWWGVKRQDPLFLHCGAWNLNKTAVSGLQEELIAYRADVLAIDTLGQAWAEALDDENNNTGITRVLAPLLVMTRALKLQTILVHHNRKAGGKHGLQVRGGSALFADVDQALFLDRVKGKPRQRTLGFLGRFPETPEEDLEIHWEVGGAYVLASAAKTEDEETKQAQAHLQQHLGVVGKATLNELVTATGQPRTTVRRLLAGSKFTKIGAGSNKDPFRYCLVGPRRQK